jgi:hypothetical protein
VLGDHPVRAAQAGLDVLALQRRVHSRSDDIQTAKLLPAATAPSYTALAASITRSGSACSRYLLQYWTCRPIS